MEYTVTLIISAPGFEDAETFTFSDERSMKSFARTVVAKATELHAGGGRRRNRSTSLGEGRGESISGGTMSNSDDTAWRSTASGVSHGTGTSVSRSEMVGTSETVGTSES